MKKVILTEKPSVARDFASALGVSTQGKSGHFEGEKYVITWAYGHLLRPKNPEEYDPNLKKWRMEGLPILPEAIEYLPNEETKKQLQVILKLLQRKDIDEIVVATDAGREGELIARSILLAAKVKIKCSRFWSSQALGREIIERGLNKRRPLEEYDRLYIAGSARQEADWLVGMNFSRLCTLMLGELYSVGRVQTAVLSLLVKRRLEIDEFRPQTYWELFVKAAGLDLKAFVLNSEKNESRFFTLVECQKRQEQIVGKQLVLAEVLNKDHNIAPPSLYSLTELQKMANRKYGMSAAETLAYAQELYERDKCISYPRSDSQYLGSENVAMALEIVDQMRRLYPIYFTELDAKKLQHSYRGVFDDSKLTDHHALIPLRPFKGDFNSHKGKVFELILKRFASSFSKNALSQTTTYIFKLTQTDNSLSFKCDGRRWPESGWTKIEGREEKEKILPMIEKGAIFNIDQVKIEEKKTLPPFEYSEATLLHDMANPGRLVNEKTLKKVFQGAVGLGTQATRAQIIETLIKRDYALKEKKIIRATEKGMHLINKLQGLKRLSWLTRPEETALWEIKLEEMAMGKCAGEDFLKKIRSFVREGIEEGIGLGSNTKGKDQEKNNGSCPLCSSPVKESFKVFECSGKNKGCSFIIWKNVAGLTIPRAQVIKLISKGKSDFLKGFKSKTGKRFSASLKLNSHGKVEFSFASSSKEVKKEVRV